jgi:hypothetical protein
MIRHLAPSARILAPQQRASKHDPSGLENEIAIGFKALSSVPFKILIAIRRDPRPKNRRHSISRILPREERGYDFARGGGTAEAANAGKITQEPQLTTRRAEKRAHSALR